MWYELAWNQKVIKEVQKEVLIAYCWLWVLQEAIPNENHRIALARVWIEEMPNVGCLSQTHIRRLDRYKSLQSNLPASAYLEVEC